MKYSKNKITIGIISTLIATMSTLAVSTVNAEEVTNNSKEQKTEEIERIVVKSNKLGFGERRAVARVGEEEIAQEAPSGDVLLLIKKVPGVHITQGDAFGGNDWSSRVFVRGMANQRDDSQIGYMINNVPNGNSTYSSGSKPNRYLDVENVSEVLVSQNAGDISSASNEALGGTIRYYTRLPGEYSSINVGFTAADHNLRRNFLRFDTGESEDGIRASLSFSDTYSNTWVGQGAGEFTRRHYDLTIAKDFDNTSLVFRGSYNERTEDDYDSVSLADFAKSPDTDGYTDLITGNPDVDENYRPSSAGDRNDALFSLDITHDFDNGNQFRITPYYHNQKGVGWYAPGYEVATLNGQADGINIGSDAREYYEGQFSRDVNGNLVDLDDARQDLSAYSCLEGRFSAGTSRIAIDSGFTCPADNVHNAQGHNIRNWTRRANDLGIERFGFTTEYTHEFSKDNSMRIGAWYQNQERFNDRSWHEILRPQNGNGDFTSIEYDSTPYFEDFKRDFDTTSLRLYVEDSLTLLDGDLETDFGIVWHRVETDYTSVLGANDRSDTGATRGQTSEEFLPKASLLYSINEDVQVFTSYSRNMRIIPENALIDGSTDGLKPETSDNYDAGIRFQGENYGINVSGFITRFNDRIGQLSENSAPDRFLVNTANLINIGDVESEGAEFAADIELSDNLAIDAAYSILNTEIIDDLVGGSSGGVRVIGSPDDLFRANVTWRADHKNNPFVLVASYEKVGSRNGNLAGTEEIPSYEVINLSASYNLESVIPGVDNLSIKLNISNLFDEDYLSTNDGAGGGSYFIGSPRSASFTVSATF